jgi:hypothetical protein
MRARFPSVADRTTHAFKRSSTSSDCVPFDARSIKTKLLNAFGESDSDFGESEHAFRTGPLSELR